MLPICGLLLFSILSYRSVSLHKTYYGGRPQRYFDWNGLHLNSDPLNKGHWQPVPCIDTPCEVIEVWRKESGWDYANYAFLLSAMPALLLTWPLCLALGKLGVSQVLTFFISTPLLAFAWFYFVGWLFEHWLHKYNIRW